MKQLHDDRPTSHPRESGYPLRLNVQPKSGPTGYLDGAWWPRSADLVTELPDLLAALAVRLGPVRRVVYDRRGWMPAPERLAIGEESVRLDAYPFELGNTMYVINGANEMIVLRVIVSTADPEIAREALTAAVAPSGPRADE